SALLFVVGSDDGAPVLPGVPAGARRLASCVRSTHPALDRLLTRLLAPFVLVEGGWTVARDIGLAAPDVVAVTREGDRFGGPSPWRAGPPGVSAVTPSALADALAQADEADLAAANASQTVELARRNLASARRDELLATERDRSRRQELEQATKRASDLRRTVDVQAPARRERRTYFAGRVEELAAEPEQDPESRDAALARVLVAEAALDEARR